MRNSTSNVLILGATGMVGSEVLAQCLANDDIKSVLTVGRRSSGTNHSKLQEVLHDDFLDYSALEAKLTDIDIVLYCLGVYQAHVSKEQFWEITVRYLEELIRIFEWKNRNVRFCLFSAQGASNSERSLMRFANAKGRAENILLAADLAHTFIFRPGFIMPGPLSRSTTMSSKLFEPIYRLFPRIGIDAPDIANVMIDVGLNLHTKQVFENRDMRTYVSGC